MRFVLLVLLVVLGPPPLLIHAQESRAKVPNTPSVEPGADTEGPIEFIAHRGASRLAPENTLPAVRLAWRRGADAVEIDVRMTQDKRIILSHDPNTKRVAPGSNRVIKDSTLEELRAIDVGRRKGKKWTDTRIPLLRRVVATIPEGRRLFIEIKGGPKIMPELVRVLTHSEKEPAQLVIISFNEKTVKRANEAFPSLEVYLLASMSRDKETGAWTPTREQLIQSAKRLGADGLDLRDTPTLDADMVSCIHQSGLGVYAWTVDSPEAARRLVDAGVDGITTNRPAWLSRRIGPRADASRKKEAAPHRPTAPGSPQGRSG